MVRTIATNGTVGTLAGATNSGFADGSGTNARFCQPSGLGRDVFGNLYVADQVNNTIRKITPDAVVSTFAGTGVAGGQDGPKDSATFKSPWGVVSDPSGNLYVTEHDGHRVRVIRSNGTVSTLAGNGTGGFVNGLGTVATFLYPAQISVDTAGNIYVADSNNGAVRKGTAATYGIGLATSSLGAPTDFAAATIDLGSLTGTGSLFVTGSAQSSNRPINLAGTTGGGVLDQSGTGALVFSGSVTATPQSG
jgi:hypothetical protein